MTNFRNIAIVNDRDEIIGAAPLFEAIEKRLLRRSCRVCVFDSSGRMLIQKRSAHVFRPRLYDFSAAGHVDEGESYEVAALRELAEELGITEVLLLPIVRSFRAHDFFSTLYKVVLRREVALKINDDEIESVQWYFPNEIDKLLAVDAHLFTPEFVRTWQLFRDKIVST